MRSVVLYCPPLQRDLRPLMDAVPDLLIYESTRTEHGEDGCVQGHLEIIREARDDHEEMVFVVEDDCEFTERWRWYEWHANALWARDNGYDVLVGGCVQTYDPKIVRTRGGVIVEVSAFHSAHCIVYFASSFEKILANLKWPNDLSVGRDAKCKIAMTWPFVAVQRPSFSGILNKQVNYVPLYEQYEEHLGRALGLVP